MIKDSDSSNRFYNILKDINFAAYSYEAFVISSIEDSKITIDDFIHYVNQEFMRLGESLGNQIMEYIYSIIWCFSNTPVEEGDTIHIDPIKHSQPGRDLVSKNLGLIGVYVFPLLLYGAEYISMAHVLFTHKDLEDYVRSEPKFSDISDVNTINHFDILYFLLKTALQARFYHIRECQVRRFLGDDDFVKKNFGQEMLPPGEWVYPAES